MDKLAVLVAISAIYVRAQSGSGGGSGQQPQQQTFNIARKIKNGGFDILSAYITNATMFSGVINHGCWCAKLNPYIDHELLGGPAPVDDLDMICKQWIAACNCMNNAVNGTCEGRHDDDYITFTLDYDTMEGDCSVNVNDTCLLDTCIVHTYYAGLIVEYLDDGSNNFVNATIANQDTCLDGFGTYVRKECIGEAPFFQFQAIPQLTAVEICRQAGGLDVVFIVDGSGSVGQANFDTQIEFLKQVTAAMDIGANATRVAFMQYESSVQIEFGFLDNPSALIQALDAVVYTGGGTSTGFAITESYNQIVVPGARQNAAVAMVVVTDGQSGDDVVAPSEAMRANGIVMAAVGYAGANYGELQAIANDPDEDYVYVGTTSADLLQMTSKLTSTICTTQQKTRSLGFRTLDIEVQAVRSFEEGVEEMF